MDALDLIVLGRQLVKIGEHALRGGPSGAAPSGRALVLRDVFANPLSSISEIAVRTGLPQSYVSESVAALCADGVLRTSSDPNDRRRTLTTISPAHRRRVARRASVQVDNALAEQIGEQHATVVLPLLQRLTDLVRPEQMGPVVAAVRAGAESTPRE